MQLQSNGCKGRRKRKRAQEESSESMNEWRALEAQTAQQQSSKCFSRGKHFAYILSLSLVSCTAHCSSLILRELKRLSGAESAALLATIESRQSLKARASVSGEESGKEVRGETARVQG